jgi:signal transduction histidine kinase
MKIRNYLKESGVLWNIGIILAVIMALGANLAGLIAGITIVFPHLLYIPVVIASYRYPRWGLPFSGLIGGIYLMMVIAFEGTATMAAVEALIRVVVLIAIGGLVALLTLRLKGQESLYRGLFDFSEGGSILVQDGDKGWVVEEANWNAAAILGMDHAAMKGMPLLSLWGEDEARNILSRFASEKKVYALETGLTTAAGETRQVLLSMASLPKDRAIITFVDVTRRVAAEHALQTANDKLHLLSRISTDHLHRTVNEMIATLDSAGAGVREGPASGIISRVRAMAGNLSRQLSLAGTYQELGASPPRWIPVQRVLEASGARGRSGEVSLRFWTERLEIYADPLLGDVLVHVVENAVRHGGSIRSVAVTYRLTSEGLDLIIEDDGIGIPADMKEKIFAYDSGGHSGLGLFICRQILGVTGMTMVEAGRPGKGARFVIRVPEENYRIEGRGVDAPPLPVPSGKEAEVRGNRHTSGTIVRELLSPEFPVADTLWIDYHQTTGDPVTDRIFAAFSGNEAVSLARCRRHPDGLEVDGIFTPERYRGHGYANAATWGLVEACGHDLLYMHSVRNLTGFYAHYGFAPIPEEELPPTIRERYSWAAGDMKGANVCPMKRVPAE